MNKEMLTNTNRIGFAFYPVQGPDFYFYIFLLLLSLPPILRLWEQRVLHVAMVETEGAGLLVFRGG